MPRLLTIAGSDSGGGAGIQADLATFGAHGCHGMSVITAVTAQNTVAVRAVHEVPVEVVREQIDAVFEDIGVDAVKIGMLASSELVLAVAERLRWHLERRQARCRSEGRSDEGPIPIVLDPVMVSKSGDSLLADSAVSALVEHLLPLATVVTPNLPEAGCLAGSSLESDAGESARWAAAGLVATAALGETARDDGMPGSATACGPPAVLLKGGHADGDPVVDLLLDGETRHRFEHPRLDSRSTHGTGCTLSAAIAARLGAGEPLERAVEGAIDYLWRAIRSAVPLGEGHGPVNHRVPASPSTSKRAE